MIIIKSDSYFPPKTQTIGGFQVKKRPLFTPKEGVNNFNLFTLFF